jgi:glycosyltransferase involved in cell wall biosynthesis
MTAPTRVAAVIPAKDEADRIAATIAGVQAIQGISLVVVVDDGSTDDTGGLAEAAGAVVVRHPRNRGKAAAMATGARRVAQEEHVTGTTDEPHALLFVDADLEDTARNLGVLVPPVLTDSADMTIAILPPQDTAGGGRGLVVGLSRRGIERLTGFRATQPLSGMRCLTRAAFDAAQPLASRWGVETALTIDILRAGMRVVEVPVALQHRVSGADLSGQLHRAAQYRDVWRALAVRGARALPVKARDAVRDRASRLRSARSK